MTDITTNISLNVPTEYATIQDALNFLEGKTITGSVDILVADGTYDISSPISPKVLDYSHLTIRGNEGDCTKCILLVNNTNNCDGFLFEDGYGVSWLNGFTVRGNSGWTAKGEWNDQCYGAGIRAVNSGNVVLGNQIQIDKMYYGIRSMNGSYVQASTSPNGTNKGGGIKCYNAGDVAFHAYNASLIIPCAEAYYAAHNEEGLGFGFCAEAGGFISCEYSIAEGSNKAGFYALSNGTNWAHGVEASYNTYGVLGWGGTVECNTLGSFTTNLHNNSVAGIYATYKGFVGANGAISYNNLHGFKSDFSGIIDITNTQANNNTSNGYYAADGGAIVGYNAVASGNTDSGFQAENGSRMNVPNSSANNNTHGYYAKNVANIFCSGFGGTGNTYFCSPDQSSVNASGGNLSSFIVDTL